jgi:hypothetical protein
MGLRVAEFCPLSLGVPHLGQAIASASGAAHSLQNFAPSRLSWLQAAHFIRWLLAFVPKPPRKGTIE